MKGLRSKMGMRHKARRRNGGGGVNSLVMVGLNQEFE